MPTDRTILEQLIAARHGCISIQTFEEQYVLTMLREIAIETGMELWLWSVSHGLRDGLLAGETSIPDTEHPAAALYYAAGQAQKRGIWVTVDLAGHLKDERTLRVLRELIARFSDEQDRLLIMIDHAQDLPPVVRAVATPFDVSLPDEDELEGILKQTLRQVNEESRIECHLSRQDLRLVVRNLRGLSRRQARQVIRDTVCEDHRFDAADMNRILAEKRRALAGEGLLEYVEAPVSLEEIGGLSRLKAWLARRQQCASDEAAAFGLSAPRGILMLGVQGAGKSLAAKAVASAWRQPLLRMDAGNLYDRYIGESERRLREALRQAERMAPVVVWIDEIEKGFASAASQSSDGGLSKRMFGTLFSWMQEHTAPVFLIATANDIEALPPELLRKGRFDEISFVDLPNLEARASIISIHLTKRHRDPAEFDIGRIAEVSDGFSGAEIEAAVVAGMHDAFAAGVELTTDYVVNAVRASPPLSVTMAEKLEQLRSWAVGRCVPAD